jgi:hypothetical protein
VLLVVMDGVVAVVGGYLWIVTAFNKIWKLQFMVAGVLAVLRMLVQQVQYMIVHYRLSR